MKLYRIQQTTVTYPQHLFRSSYLTRLIQANTRSCMGDPPSCACRAAAACAKSHPAMDNPFSTSRRIKTGRKNWPVGACTLRGEVHADLGREVGVVHDFTQPEVGDLDLTAHRPSPQQDIAWRNTHTETHTHTHTKYTIKSRKQETDLRSVKTPIPIIKTEQKANRHSLCELN